MWYVARTQPFKEDFAKDLLRSNLCDVKDVYIPYIVDKGDTYNGKVGGHVVPALKGFLFVNFEGNIKSSLDDYGWFKCRFEKYYPKTGKKEKVTVHLLNNGQPDEKLDEIVRNSIIPDRSMLDFRSSIDQIASGIGDMRIEQESYSKLVQVNDVVVVLQGPMKGREGVVKRVKEEDGKKNRRFFISFGNNLCISLSGIHQNDIAVVHEAVDSENGKAVTLWRDIDTVEGSLQKSGNNDNAPQRLRELIIEYNKVNHISRPAGVDDKEWLKKVKENTKENNKHKTGVLSLVDSHARPSLKSLGEQLKPSTDKPEDKLSELIPNIIIRPFLTPSSGLDMEEGKDYAILPHKDFTEYIIRKDLGGAFRHGTYEKDKYNAIFDEDYIYYAHVAVFNEPDCHRAVVSWGEFYNQYELLEEDSQTKFKEDLKKYKYEKLYNLLTKKTTENGGDFIQFGKTNCIGGFYIDINSSDNDVTVAHQLVDDVAPAAVEMWQGTRMRERWRTLLQRYVLLHKVPVRDMPSVIPYSEKINNIFTVRDNNGNPDIPKITESLNCLKPLLNQFLVDNKPYDAVTIFLQVAQGISTHFVDDEHWNFLPKEGYTPDDVCSGLVSLLLKGELSSEVRKYIWQGMAELQNTDGWRYFHLPSCLKFIGKFKE